MDILRRFNSGPSKICPDAKNPDNWGPGQSRVDCTSTTTVQVILQAQKCPVGGASKLWHFLFVFGYFG